MQLSGIDISTERHGHVMKTLLCCVANIARSMEDCVVMAKVDEGRHFHWLASMLDVRVGDSVWKVELASMALDLIHAIHTTTIASAFMHYKNLLHSGLLWKLLLLLLIFEPKVQRDDSNYIGTNTIALKSGGMVVTLIRTLVDDPLIASLQQSVMLALAIPIVVLLGVESIEAVLTILHDFIQVRTVIWTSSMRSEVVQLQTIVFKTGDCGFEQYHHVYYVS